MSRAIWGGENKAKEVLGGMAGTPATKPETLLRRLAGDKSVPGRIRLRAIEWLMLMEKKITWEQFPQDSKADKEAGLSALAGMVRESPVKTRETFADATAHGPQIDPANSMDD